MSQRSSWGSNTAAGKGRRRLRYWADLHDGRGYARHSMTIRGTRRDGAAALRDLWARHASDCFVPTIGQAYEWWYLPDQDRMLGIYLDKRQPGKKGELVKPGTYKQNLSTWRVHVAPRWKDTSAGDVRYSDVQEWLDGMTEQTAQRSLSMLRSILRFCLLNECIDKNVAEYGYRMPTKAARRGDGVWSLDDLLNRVWPSVHGRLCEPAFILSAFDSCRTGEALAPLLDEIEEMRIDGMTFASVPILRQVSNNGEVSDEGDLKNRWSPRPTAVPEPWSLRILQLRDEGIERGDAWLSDNGLGEPIGQKVLRDDFDRALEEAGIERQQFRALRRSWRTWIATMGISYEILEKMMGHVGEGTTGRHYLKIDRELIARELARAFSSQRIKIDWDILGRK